MQVKYYDIGLKLFCKQFQEPEKIILDAEKEGVCCILTGTDRKENRKINDFVKEHRVFGTAGIHPHNADGAKKEDYDWMNIFQWGFPLALPDGYAMTGGGRNCAKRYASFR